MRPMDRRRRGNRDSTGKGATHPRVVRRRRFEGEAGPGAVVCRHCHREFRAITYTHLRMKHRYRGLRPVEDYKRRYGVPVATCRDTRRIIRRHIRGYWSSQGRRWTATRIVEALRAHARAGGAAPGRLERSLALAIRRRFGSWERAMERAGLSPRAHRRLRRWDEERLAAAIRARHAAGKSIADSVLLREDPGLHLAAVRRHGSWGRALAAYGFDPLAHRAERKWSLEGAKAWILARRAAGRPYTAADAPSGMHQCVTRHVEGGWAAFVASLGVPYEGRTIRRGSRTREGIAREIRALRRAGKAVNVSALAASRPGAALLKAASRVFGSWEDALRAAGVDPTKVRLRRSLRAPDVAAAIRARRTAGGSLEETAVATADWSLVRAAKRHHGTWDRALRAAWASAKE
jgi:hypothetical protein